MSYVNVISYENNISYVSYMSHVNNINYVKWYELRHGLSKLYEYFYESLKIK